MASDEQSTWLAGHIRELQAQIAALTKQPDGKGPRSKKAQAEASTQADRLERRLSRLMRAAANLEAQAKAQGQRARRLAKSKSPADRAELLLSALDELPIDLALQVCEEGARRARQRAGEERVDA